MWKETGSNQLSGRDPRRTSQLMPSRCSSIVMRIFGLAAGMDCFASTRPYRMVKRKLRRSEYWRGRYWPCSKIHGEESGLALSAGGGSALAGNNFKIFGGEKDRGRGRVACFAEGRRGGKNGGWGPGSSRYACDGGV